MPLQMMGNQLKLRGGDTSKNPQKNSNQTKDICEKRDD